MTDHMKTQVLFIHGGGSKEDYGEDAKLVHSLRANLGASYRVHYPFLKNEPAPDFGRTKQIEKEVSSLKGTLILVGHSLGASMILKYASECKIQKEIAGVFLIATPFWKGEQKWIQALKLNVDFSSKLPKNIPVFLYHCCDDQIIPIAHLFQYQKKLPQAVIRKFKSGGHQLNYDLTPVATDIKTQMNRSFNLHQ